MDFLLTKMKSKSVMLLLRYLFNVGILRYLIASNKVNPTFQAPTNQSRHLKHKKTALENLQGGF